MEGITDRNYAIAKRVCEDFKIKYFEKYHDLYVQSDTLLLADVFENFRNISLKIYVLYRAKFIAAPGLAWQAALKRLKYFLLTVIHMLLMLEKSLRIGICLSIYRYPEANNKYMKDYDEHKESLYTQYLDLNNLYGWDMSQKFPVNNFEWIKDTSQINEDFIKSYNEESDERYFLEVDVQYLEILHELHNDLPFLPERMKIEKVGKLVPIYMIKLNMLSA